MPVRAPPVEGRTPVPYNGIVAVSGELFQPLSSSALPTGRVLPVVDPLLPLLPAGGLVRGRAVACDGVAAMSLALSLAVGPTVAGSWLAIVDVPTLGLEAAEELGIPLERIVRIDPAPQRPIGDAWAELTAAAFDGFELVITRVPRRLNAALARKVQARQQAREAVMITLGQPGPLSVDVELHANAPQWEGVAEGSGHLCGRKVNVTASGRRVPQPRSASLWLPGPDGSISLTTDDPGVVEREAAC
jgi:hypothetical protein